uniref:Uncharacterized protein n=1 Tax=Arundo donax TaxID=35708 RepID=A0A0A9FTY9_ARUDO
MGNICKLTNKTLQLVSTSRAKQKGKQHKICTNTQY